MTINAKINRHNIPVELTLTVNDLLDLSKFLNNESVKAFMEQQDYSYYNLKLIAESLRKEADKVNDITGGIL
tara:strand:+ start:869 stop:1084 length:216 start_codon:yes stop_codon:yes gene_type:complete